jgi:hypothetical protein
VATTNDDSDLGAWQRALEEQHEAEYQLAAAGTSGSPDYGRLVAVVHELRTRADLLLAAAVASRHRALRDRKEARPTQPFVDLDAPPESFSAK